MHTIGEMARLSGVSSRTLRHYDQIGLLQPSGRSVAGYRLYSSLDAERLQQILLYRELDFPLSKITLMLLSPSYNRKEALEKQADLLDQRSARLSRLAITARKTLDLIEGGKTMGDKEMFDGFDYDLLVKTQKELEPEVQARWGNTDAYRVSKERTSRYTKADWKRLQEHQDIDLQVLAGLFTSGALPGDKRVQEIVGRARAFIDETYYPCSWEMFGSLGEMYSADERFAAFYDKFAAGLSGFYSKAIRLRCEAEGRID